MKGTRSTKYYSNQQEKRIAKDLNGRTQPGSGAINITGLKGDVVVTDSTEWDVLVEAKTTMTNPGQEGKRTLTFHKEWIKEVQTHAFQQGKAMGLVVTSFDNKEDFYTLGKIDFTNMRSALIEYENGCKQRDNKIADLNSIISLLMMQLDKGYDIDLDMRMLKRHQGVNVKTEYDEERDALLVSVRKG